MCNPGITTSSLTRIRRSNLLVRRHLSRPRCPFIVKELLPKSQTHRFLWSHSIPRIISVTASVTTTRKLVLNPAIEKWTTVSLSRGRSVPSAVLSFSSLVPVELSESGFVRSPNAHNQSLREPVDSVHPSGHPSRLLVGFWTETSDLSDSQVDPRFLYPWCRSVVETEWLVLADMPDIWAFGSLD